MATTESGHATGRCYIDQDGQFHLNGASVYSDESGTTLAGAEMGLVDGVTAGTVTASKAVTVNASKQVNELQFAAQAVTPAADSGAGSTILPGVRSVQVGTVTNDADDWIVLPALSTVPDGHEITIVCGAGGNFEMRTPATSAEEINSEDCDGTKEYLCTDTQIVKVIKIDGTIGWMAHAYTAIGAVATAVVPD